MSPKSEPFAIFVYLAAKVRTPLKKHCELLAGTNNSYRRSRNCFFSTILFELCLIWNCAVTLALYMGQKKVQKFFFELCGVSKQPPSTLKPDGHNCTLVCRREGLIEQIADPGFNSLARSGLNPPFHFDKCSLRCRFRQLINNNSNRQQTTTKTTNEPA